MMEGIYAQENHLCSRESFRSVVNNSVKVPSQALQARFPCKVVKQKKAKRCKTTKIIKHYINELSAFTIGSFSISHLYFITYSNIQLLLKTGSKKSLELIPTRHATVV